MSLLGGVDNVAKSRDKPCTSAITGRKALVDVSNVLGQRSKNGGKQGISVNTGRKALADVSNVLGDKSKTGVNTGRKASADVSNFLGYKPRNGVPDSTKPRVSITSTKSLSALPLKPSMAQSNKKPGQGFGKHHITINGAKDVNIFSMDQKTKSQVREFINTNGRITARKPPIMSRKSIPALKRVVQLDTSGGKENSDISGKGRGKYHLEVGRKAVLQVKNARSNPWKNRVRDDFIIMAPRDQTHTELSALSRKSLRPIVKNIEPVLNAQRTSKLTCRVGSNKSISLAAISSRKKKEVAVYSVPKKSSTAVAHEQSGGQLQSNGDNSSATATNMVSRGKTKRRRSYTSLLMEKSKLIEEKVSLENLPSIDDNRNHLEVAEYIDDICQYYWLAEAQNPSPANSMTIQTEITPPMRGILVNWLIEVHFKFDLMPETLYLMISLLDRYLSLVKINKSEMQLVGLTALLLASKYEDYWHPKVKDLISISVESYTRDQMLGMEKLILRKLKFRLNVATPYVFMLRFLKAAQSDMKLEHLAFYLMELCLVEYEPLKYKPSLICASAIYVARITLQMSPAWTPLLAKHARYEESEIRDCAEMILRFHKGAKTSMLNVTYEKYMRPDCSGIAAMKPVDQLPN